MNFRWLVAIAVLAAMPALAQQKLKFAHVYETSEPYHTQAVWAAGEIAKRTSNRYTMDVFPASSLGNETQINQSLSLGTVDVIYTGQAFAARSTASIEAPSCAVAGWGPVRKNATPRSDVRRKLRSFMTSPFCGLHRTASVRP